MRNLVSPDFCCKTNPRPCWLTSVPRRVGFVELKYDSVEGDEEVIKCLLCCCVRWQFLCSTDSLICPCTYCSMVANYVLVGWWSTQGCQHMVTVSQERQRMRVWTCLSADGLSRLGRLKYTSYCDFHALKSALRSTCSSSLGRSPQ